jgi:sortase (surface protein transpeptidase)
VKEILKLPMIVTQPFIEENQKMKEKIKKQEEEMREEKIQDVKQLNEWIPEEIDKEQFKEGYYVFVETYYDGKQFIFPFHPSMTVL